MSLKEIPPLSYRRVRKAKPSFIAVKSYSLDLIDDSSASEFDSDEEEKHMKIKNAFKKKPKTSFDHSSNKAILI